MKTLYAPMYEPPPVRIVGAEKLLRLQAISGKIAQKDSLFTLHSASGFRRPDGSVEIEKIAGYCHDRRMLRTYWLHRIHLLIDAVTGDEIDNLADWIAAAEPSGAFQDSADFTAAHAGAPAPPPSGKHAAAAIDEAVKCALEQGDRAMAERLFRIGGLLKTVKLDCAPS